jgi:hypothetical protein
VSITAGFMSVKKLLGGVNKINLWITREGIWILAHGLVKGSGTWSEKDKIMK